MCQLRAAVANSRTKAYLLTDRCPRIGHGDLPHAAAANAVINQALELFPNGGIFLFMKGPSHTLCAMWFCLFPSLRFFKNLMQMIVCFDFSSLGQSLLIRCLLSSVQMKFNLPLLCLFVGVCAGKNLRLHKDCTGALEVMKLSAEVCVCAHVCVVPPSFRALPLLKS